MGQWSLRGLSLRAKGKESKRNRSEQKDGQIALVGSTAPSEVESHKNQQVAGKSGSTASSLPTVPLSQQNTLSPSAAPSVTGSISRDKHKDPTGLHVVHTPVQQHAIDIIFVHGLDGSAKLSWSWKRNLACFWPKEWLPHEPGLSRARILVFGYKAFARTSEPDILNISDFAKDLLLKLKVGTSGDGEPLRIGQALILGSQDPAYQETFRAVRGLVFFGTPHRGSELAETLDKYLKYSFQSSKQYVKDLQKHSATLEEINYSFRFLARGLRLVSFYETVPSKLGPYSSLVVEKDSATMGYDTELCAPLQGRHHEINKYPSTADSNYTTVKDVIRNMVEECCPVSMTGHRRSSSSSFSMESMERMLDDLMDPRDQSENLDSLLEVHMPGSSDWILSEPQMQHWLDSQRPSPLVFVIAGHAGSGKSVMAAFLVQKLQYIGKQVQYFFYRFDDLLSKGSGCQCLVSLAYQMATSSREYGRRLLALLQSRHFSINADMKKLWQKMFIGLFSGIDMEPVYWVIDAIDESESVAPFLNLLPSLQTAKVPVRIVFLTRPKTVESSFQKLRNAMDPELFLSMEMKTPTETLRHYIHNELPATTWPEEPMFRDYVVRTLLEKSQGNFLWLRLIINELDNCDYVDDAKQALESTPPELADVYRRMQGQLLQNMSDEDRKLAVRILSWVAYAERQLVIPELAEALHSQGKPGRMLNLQRTIGRLCGDMVVVDQNDTVFMVHHTAKEFLCNSEDEALSIGIPEANAMLLRRCLEILSNPQFRFLAKTKGVTGLLQYASSFWSRHLVATNAADTTLAESVAQFLQSRAVLTWIEAVGRLGNLRILIRASADLASFVSRQRQDSSGWSSLNPPAAEGLNIICAWAIDIERVVGKFGDQLIRHPEAIFSLIPCFSPSSSAISRQFASGIRMELTVSGMNNVTWNDSVASFSVGADAQPTAIYSGVEHFAIHSDFDTVSVYSASVFQKVRQFCHDSMISALCFSPDGHALVACGMKTIKIWKITGEVASCFDNPPGSAAVAASISHDRKKLTVCCTDGALRSRCIDEGNDWHTIRRHVKSDSSLGSETGTPWIALFSPDGSKIAIVFKGYAPGIWDTATGALLGHSQRRIEKGPSRYPYRLTWNPANEHIVGIFNDGKLFKWDPADTHVNEMEISFTASELACSPDGRHIVTANGSGSLHIWDYESFQLVYHLECASNVTAIAISLDGRHIYDLRGSFCNVWEPGCPVWLREEDARASKTNESFTRPQSLLPTHHAERAMSEPITAFASTDDGEAHCFAKDDGEVMWQCRSGDVICAAPNELIGPRLIALSQDGSLIAHDDSAGNVVILQVEETLDKVARNLTTFHPEGLAQQMLFLNDGSMILLRCASLLSLWDVKTGKLRAVAAFKEVGIQVAIHPLNPSVALVVGLKSVTSVTLPGLTTINSRELGARPSELSPGGGSPVLAPILSSRQIPTVFANQTGVSSAIDRLFCHPSEALILVQTMNKSNDWSCRAEFFTIPYSMSTGTTDDGIVPEALPLAVLNRIQIPLGFVSDDMALKLTIGRSGKHSLAFLDIEFWICTWSPSDTVGERMRRHFFLPKDWINVDCLELARVSVDGTFYCPKNGNLAVVRHGLENSWAGV